MEGMNRPTFETSRVTPESGVLGLLRRVALMALPAGAAGSLVLMFHLSRRQNSKILLFLFASWVLSPFLALAGANVWSKARTIQFRAALYTVMLTITLGDLGIYGVVASGLVQAKPGFIFLVVPFTSLVLIAVVLLAATFLSSKASGTPGGD